MSTNTGVNPHPETRPAWKTTEFWLTASLLLAGFLQQALGIFNVKDETTAKIMGLLGAAYAVARGLAKLSVPNVPYAPDPQPQPAVESTPVAVAPGTTYSPIDDTVGGDELDSGAEGLQPDTDIPPDEGDANAENKG